MTTAGIIGKTIKDRLFFLISFSLIFMAIYYLLLMGSLVLRFGHMPNYVTPYNWIKNVWVITQSTPSLSDMVPIILEEWLLEIGYMNYNFGNGISEWSLNLMPAKMLIVLLVGFLIALNIALLQKQSRSCSKGAYRSALATTGVGGLLVGLTNATMTWVVCCATPSWVVGLAMLGLGVSTSLWLEPLGLWLAWSGFIFLALTAVFLSRKLILPSRPTYTKEPLYAE